jgi:hypothetical protein
MVAATAPWQPAERRVECARKILLASCVALASACADVSATQDGATSSDGPWPGAHGRVHLVMADDNIAAGDTLDLAVSSIELTSDREPNAEPLRVDVGRIQLDASGHDVAFDRVPPGLYAAIEIELGGDAPVLEAMLHNATQTFVIRTSGALSLVARCEQGQPITVSGTLQIGVDFALGGAIAALARHPLPAPVDGVVVIDETSAPEAIADFRSTLAASIHAECTHEDH